MNLKASRPACCDSLPVAIRLVGGAATGSQLVFVTGSKRSPSLFKLNHMIESVVRIRITVLHRAFRTKRRGL